MRSNRKIYCLTASLLCYLKAQLQSLLDEGLHRVNEAANHLAHPDEHGRRIFFRRQKKLGWHFLTLLHTIIGTGLIASGTAALNQWYERVADGKMRRTQARPLPSGRLDAGKALMFAIAISVAGFVELWFGANPLAALLGLLTLLTYLFVYTPLKQRSPHSTTIGAIRARCRR